MGYEEDSNRGYYPPQQNQYGPPPGAPPQGQYGPPPGAPPEAHYGQQPQYGQAPYAPQPGYNGGHPNQQGSNVQYSSVDQRGAGNKDDGDCCGTCCKACCGVCVACTCLEICC